ncbi:MAG TPA: DUF47 family protein [Patescibacteria group bacterium]|nr:DUF47 family protein [Patescibacteria group bacterium]
MKKRSFLDRLFPPKYDFYGMLSQQAELTAQGVTALSDWMDAPGAANSERLLRLVAEADAVRMQMEEELIEAFATPFDRQDIYTFSVRMDRIIEFAKFTVLDMQSYAVPVDEYMTEMATSLRRGTRDLSQATLLLKDDPQKVAALIDDMRWANAAVLSSYREALAELFRSEDALDALKRREVYHSLKDAAEYLDLVVDVLHRIVVRLV